MAEPLSLEQAKAQLRILGNDDDVLLNDAIADARGWIESYTGLTLTRREVIEVQRCFGDKLSAWPIASVDKVAYVDAAGQEAELPPTAYLAQLGKRPACLLANSWPRIRPGSFVEVTMTAGFASPAAVAAFAPNLVRAMRLLVASYFEDRATGGLSGDVEIAAKRLCRNFKRWSV